jgi:hypothetical protein
MQEHNGKVNSMDIFLLLKSLAGLLGILMILIFFLMYRPKKTPIKKKVPPKKKERFGDDFNSLENLLQIIKNKKSTTKELQSALDLIIKHHGTIHPKLGIRAHPEFKVYAEIVLRICRHPNTNKNIIVKFDKELIARNEEYKKDISDFLTKGLESRGA